MDREHYNCLVADLKKRKTIPYSFGNRELLDTFIPELKKDFEYLEIIRYIDGEYEREFICITPSAVKKAVKEIEKRIKEREISIANMRAAIERFR